MKYTVEPHKLSNSFAVYQDGKLYLSPGRGYLDQNVAYAIARFLSGNIVLNKDNASDYQRGYDDAIRMMLEP